jgi:hypothetical protein
MMESGTRASTESRTACTEVLRFDFKITSGSVTISNRPYLLHQANTVSTHTRCGPGHAMRAPDNFTTQHVGLLANDFPRS